MAVLDEVPLMAVTRVIDGVHIIQMGMANAFLVESHDGLTLIDAGYPNNERAVFAALREFGRSPNQLKHLIFTHGHPDHIGSAAAIVRETGARTYMHPLVIFFGKRRSFQAFETGARAVARGAVQADLPSRPAAGASRDQPGINQRGSTGHRRWHRGDSCTRALRRPGRAPLAAGTNAVCW